jgi:hypothetical protein
MTEKFKKQIEELKLNFSYKDNSSRIIFCTLKPVETVTIAPNSTK